MPMFPAEHQLLFKRRQLSSHTSALLSGRRVLIASTFAVWSIILVLFVTYGYENTWSLWNVPVLRPSFADLRLITGTADSVRAGLDPTIENPGDPFGRVFNYPALWYLLFHTNITQASTKWISMAMLAMFFLVVILFPGALSTREAVLMVLVLFSPAAMLLYERGNVDALVFVVCGLGLMTVETSAGLAALLFLFGALLKIYPFFGLIVFVQDGAKAFVRRLVMIGSAFLAYVIATAKNVSGSWNLTMRGDDLSYGVNVLFARFAAQFTGVLSRWFTNANARRSLIVVPYVLAFAVIVMATTVAMHAASGVPVRSRRNLNAFRLGAAIYVGTFLFGNNWDYRLVFLLFVIPQVGQWMRAPGYGLISRWAMTLIILSTWYLLIGYSHATVWFVVDECAKWGLMAILVYLLVASMPEWIKAPYRLARGTRRFSCVQQCQ
jgi:hypothetical protein